MPEDSNWWLNPGPGQVKATGGLGRAPMGPEKLAGEECSP